MEKRTISDSRNPVPRFRCFTIFVIAFLLIIPSVILDAPFELIGISSANTPPVIDNITVSSYYAHPGSKEIYIHINATDNENPEYNLTIDRIEWRVNNSQNQDPPNKPWQVDSTKFTINLDEGYVLGAGGYIRASIFPSENAILEEYDVRVKVEDPEGDVSHWAYLHKAFVVSTPPHTYVEITLQNNEVYRGNTVFITVNVTDILCNESELTVEILYGKIGGPWSNLNLSSEMYNTSDGGYWKIPFSPSTNWSDSKLGKYEFQGRVKNDQGVYSNGGSYWHALDTLEVKNNVPKAISILSNTTTVNRGNTIAIYVNGTDRETPDYNLIPFVQYRHNKSSIWRNNYLEISEPDSNESFYEIEFKPDDHAKLGYYDFRVKFYDGLENSSWLTVENILEVRFGKPVITALTFGDDTVFRMDSVVITANVTDEDQEEYTLIPNFQYKGPNDEGWINQNQSNYFGNAQSMGTIWVIPFNPPAQADLGLYSFRVDFIDEAGYVSEPFGLIDVLNVMNNEPWVTIESPRWSLQNYPIITFEAEGFDEEGSNLTYEWNFGNGGTSNEPSTIYAYHSGGEYSVSVRVTDEDGGSSEEFMRVRVTGGFTTDSDDDGLTDIQEFDLGTDIENPDTDSDGIIDSEDHYPLDPTRWRSPLQEFLLGFFIGMILLTLTIIYLTYRRLNAKEKKEVEK